MFEDHQEGKDTLSRGVLGHDVAVPNVCPSCLTTNFSPRQHTGSCYTKGEMVHLEHALSNVGLPYHFVWSIEELRVSFFHFCVEGYHKLCVRQSFIEPLRNLPFSIGGCRVDLKNKHVHCQTPTVFSQFFQCPVCVCVPVLWVAETKHCDKKSNNHNICHKNSPFVFRETGQPTNNNTTNPTKQNHMNVMFCLADAIHQHRERRL